MDVLDKWALGFGVFAVVVGLVWEPGSWFIWVICLAALGAMWWSLRG